MKQDNLVDHLFRHQYGKMVSILTRIFGLSNLELVEDAVQDTFISAFENWKFKRPENPEAWLTLAAKNRVVDLLRKLKADNNRINNIDQGASAISLNDLFLDHEIEDSQLRMIFTACHPSLKSSEQIAFALKTISGFSTKEIASALLQKEETIKKRLSRARKLIVRENISFEIPSRKDLDARLDIVLEVIYLTFNEGFHSNNQKKLIRKELCGEAIRLCRLLLNRINLRSSKVYALFALMCFHAARLESRIGVNNEIIDLKNQDRTKWFFPLVKMGNEAMNKAVEDNVFTSLHYEAAIAGEHHKAKDFESTDWKMMLTWYENLYHLLPSPFTLLNKSIVLIQMKKHEEAKEILDSIDHLKLEQRAYLFFGTLAEYHISTGEKEEAIRFLNQAINCVSNQVEKNYLQNKKASLYS